MKKLFKVSALVLGLGLSFSQGASANTVDLGTIVPDGTSTAFDSSSMDAFTGVNFTHNFDFILGSSSNGLATSSIQASFTEGNTSSDSISTFYVKLFDLTKNDTPVSFSTVIGSDGLTSAVYGANLFAGDKYEIQVTGIAGSDAFYSGSISVSPVPEPEEWAMMMLGMGLMGMKLRSKSNAQNLTTIAV